MRHTMTFVPMSSSTGESAMNYSFQRRLRKLAVSAALVLSAGMIASPSQAQWLVQDNTSIGKSVEEFIKQAERWQSTIQQYQQEVAHFQQMLNTFQNLPSLLGGLTANTLKPMSDADKASLIQQNCPGASGTGIVQQVLSATGLTAPTFGQNIAASQQQICAQMTELQVEQYNDTIDQINRLDGYITQMNAIEGMRGGISEGDPNSIGKLQGVTDQAERTKGAMEAEMQSYSRKIEAKRVAIQTLQSQQSMLATVALKGKPSLTGQLVQAAAFAAAFSN